MLVVWMVGERLYRCWAAGDGSTLREKPIIATTARRTRFIGYLEEKRQERTAKFEEGKGKEPGVTLCGSSGEGDS
jgi:hypothetical protein